MNSVSLKGSIHVQVWLGELDSGAGLGLISPHTYERGDPHTDEFGSLEPEPSRVGLASQTRTCMGPFNLRQSVGLLGQGINPLQGRYIRETHVKKVKLSL
jgi:hypothetical protein